MSEYCTCQIPIDNGIGNKHLQLCNLFLTHKYVYIYTFVDMSINHICFELHYASVTSQ